MAQTGDVLSLDRKFLFVIQAFETALSEEETEKLDALSCFSVFELFLTTPHF
jgi:hypothetical protein